MKEGGAERRAHSDRYKKLNLERSGVPHDKCQAGKTRHGVLPRQHGQKCHMDTRPVLTPRVTLCHRFATYKLLHRSCLSRCMLAALTGHTRTRDE